MGIIVDFIVIGIVLLSTFLAYQKGLVKLAIGLCAFIISLAVTFVLYQPIANLVIQNTNIDETIEDAIYEKAYDVLEEEPQSQESIKSQIAEAAQNELLPQTARDLAVNIVKGSVMIVLFLIVKIALRFITVLTDVITKLPIIHQINQTTGMIYGVIRGILIVYVALLILTVPGKINPNNIVNHSINQSILAKAMYNYNILNVFF